MTGRRTLRRTQFLPGARADVFPFFEEAANLESITPPWLRFHVTEAPVPPLRRGSLIAYRLRLLGMPLRWRTRIERFDPGFGFVDVQIEGPYTEWVHVHSFSDSVAGVLMEDRVDYRLPFGALGALAAPVIAAQLWSIFAYRRRRVRRLLVRASSHARPRPRPEQHDAQTPRR